MELGPNKCIFFQGSANLPHYNPHGIYFLKTSEDTLCDFEIGTLFENPVITENFTRKVFRSYLPHVPAFLYDPSYKSAPKKLPIKINISRECEETPTSFEITKDSLTQIHFMIMGTGDTLIPTQSQFKYLYPKHGIYHGKIYASRYCIDESIDFQVLVDTMPIIELDKKYDFKHCEEKGVLLSVDSIRNESILWSTGSTKFQHFFSKTGNYDVSVRNKCGEIHQPIEIEELFPQYPDTLKIPLYDTLINVQKFRLCNQEKDTIQIEYDNKTLPFYYVMGDGKVIQQRENPIYHYSTKGFYNGYVYAEKDCKPFHIPFQIQVDSFPKTTLLPYYEFYNCQDKGIELTEDSIYNQSIFWSTQDTNFQIFLYEEGNYAVNLQNTCGNKEHQFEVQELILSNGNIITPNGDGKNETFVIENLAPEHELKIVNRWGKIVYETSDYQQNWSGENLSDGTYFYEITIKDCIYKGWLQIIR